MKVQAQKTAFISIVFIALACKQQEQSSLNQAPVSFAPAAATMIELYSDTKDSNGVSQPCRDLLQAPEGPGSVSQKPWQSAPIRMIKGGERIATHINWDVYVNLLRGQGFDRTNPVHGNIAKNLETLKVADVHLDMIGRLLCQRIVVHPNDYVVLDGQGNILGARPNPVLEERLKGVALMPFINLSKPGSANLSRVLNRSNGDEVLAEARVAADQWIKDHPDFIKSAELKYSQTFRTVSKIIIAYEVVGKGKEYHFKYDPGTMKIQRNLFAP